MEHRYAKSETLVIWNADKNHYAQQLSRELLYGQQDVLQQGTGCMLNKLPRKHAGVRSLHVYSVDAMERRLAVAKARRF